MTLIRLVVLSFVFILSVNNHFQVQLWKNFNLDSTILVFSHTSSSVTIELPERSTMKNQQKYFYTEDKLLMEFTHQGKTIQVLSLGKAIIIRGLEEHEKIILHSDIHLKRESYIKTLKDSALGSISRYQKLEGSKISISGSFDTFIFGIHQNMDFESIQAIFLETRETAKKRIVSWLKKKSIADIHTEFATEMLSQTIGSLCKEGGHIGLCQLAHFGTKHARYEIDMRHSFLSLDLLSQQYPKTALFLFEQMINLFQDRLFYQEGHLSFVPIPEHLDIFRIYIKQAKQNFEQLNQLSIRAKAVLNGLINQILLQDVNNLQEEINYRETQNVHPTLYKMLTMKWKANSAKRAVSSIYQESFTPDYFYNYPNETLDTCVSKTAWLTHAVEEYSNFVHQIGDPLDKSSLEQPVSLQKVVKRFMNSDSEAENGRYFSINSVGGGVRIYNKQGGYESLLPFVYGLTDIFPEEHLKNITTKYGLVSLNTDHPKFNEHYEYRGNIHSCFNFKILRELKKKVNNKRYAEFKKLVDDVLVGIKTFLVERWQKKESFTMWNASGRGLRNKKHLSIVNVGFLGQME